MKKILSKALIIATLGMAFFADAQFRTRNRMDRLESFDEQKFSWGFFLNANSYDFHFVLDERYGMNQGKNLVTGKRDFSFGAGLIGKMRINENLDLRLEPGLQFAEREINFETQSNNQYYAGTLTNPPFVPLTLQTEDVVRTVKSTFVDIPVLVELHGVRWYNTRPYIAGGVNYIMNLQSNSDSTEDNLQRTWRSTTHNFAYSAEAGVQIYFSRFKLTPAIRGTFFMNNEIVGDNAGTPPFWTAALDTAKSRAIMFILKFE